MASSVLRRVAGTLLASLLAGLVVAGFAGPTQAASGYRYWNYFHLKNGAWAFSKVGAGDYQPRDGAVEGYRYGTSATANGIPPRADLTQVNFDTVCGGRSLAPGQKRVAILLDYGTEADSQGQTPPGPRAECAVVPAKASGQQVLAAVADLRIEGGLICAVNGYPVKGCGTAVKNAPAPRREQPVTFRLPGSPDPATSASASPGTSAGTKAATGSPASDDGGATWPLVGVGVLVAVVAAGAVALNRRRTG